MKQQKRCIEKGGSGHIVLIAEEAEDMWHFYNLIRVGDLVNSQTTRKVVMESATGSTSSQKVHTTLTVKVGAIDFDPGASAIHLKGRVVVENEVVKLGSYHTLDLKLNKKFTLEKTDWDCFDLQRLKQSLDPTTRADVAAVVLHEGLAHICLLTPAMTLERAKIEMQIPRKRKGHTPQHEKGINRFLDAVAFLRHVNFEIVKCVLIASRGFLKEQFMEHLVQFAERHGKKVPLITNRFLLTHSNSGFEHALKEVLEDPAVATRLADTKAQTEVKALNTFFQLMSNEPDRVYYGFNHVTKANKEQAIETLMLADSLFRSQDIATRKKYVRLVESVRGQNGNVLIFSSMHVSGEQLALLTGCAAILRFPMPEIEDEELDDEDAAN